MTLIVVKNIVTNTLQEFRYIYSRLMDDGACI